MYQQYFDNRVPRDSRIKHYALDGMSGGSDYFSFLEVGIPAGGLATGASSIKSVEERSRHGGLANAQLDPCYHQRCDDFANIAQDVLSVMVKSIGGVLEQAGGNENLREWMAY
jgi:Zn-dependent M28 family amino/carboxypeptidase